MPGSMMQYLRWWSQLLDNRFRVPGTNVRFGIDPILSLIPGLGDIATPVFTVVLLMEGIRQGVPKVILMRMAGNAITDAVIGVFPILGDVGDLFWRANAKNMTLLERHMHGGVQPTRSDYVFVWGAAAVLGVIVAIPVIAGIWLAIWIMANFV